MFTVTFASKDGKDELNAVGARLSISNTILAAKNKNDKNYNVNNIWASSPGQQQFSFSGKSYTFKAAWVTDLTNVKVYIHLDGINGYVDTNGSPDELKVTVTGPEFSEPQTFILNRGSQSKSFNNIKVGAYHVVVEGFPAGTRSADPIVENGKTTTVMFP
jgi:hypothetical protein